MTIRFHLLNSEARRQEGPPGFGQDLFPRRFSKRRNRFDLGRSRVDSHRDVGGKARGRRVRYAVLTPRIRVRPSAIRIISLAKSRVRPVDDDLSNGVP